MLNFEKDFLAVEDANVFPLLARYDQYIDYERQKKSYGPHPVGVMETGHVTGMLSPEQLLSHIAVNMDRNSKCELILL